MYIEDFMGILDTGNYFWCLKTRGSFAKPKKAQATKFKVTVKQNNQTRHTEKWSK